MWPAVWEWGWGCENRALLLIQKYWDAHSYWSTPRMTNPFWYDGIEWNLDTESYFIRLLTRTLSASMDIRNSLVQAICLLLAIFETHRKLGNNDTNEWEITCTQAHHFHHSCRGKRRKQCMSASNHEQKYALYATNEALYGTNDKYKRIPNQYWIFRYGLTFTAQTDLYRWSRRLAIGESKGHLSFKRWL